MLYHLFDTKSSICNSKMFLCNSKMFLCNSKMFLCNSKMFLIFDRKSFSGMPNRIRNILL